jgi:16S rRNA (cytidine1402-2'-O)-methyltransferase
VLKEVDLIAAEDTRRTRCLLSTYNINTRLTSYHKHNNKAKLPYLLEQLKEKNIALVSEAGMPGLSDPGYELITAAIERNIPVIPIPGASALTTALVVSGLPISRFLYLGFLPGRAGERRRLLKSIADQPYTIVAFEAPHRLISSLRDIREILGDRQLAACRELTKIHEEVFRGTVTQALEHFVQPRGEFTLVIAGKTPEELEISGEIRQKLSALHRQGAGAREAISQISRETGIRKKKLYQVWLEITGGTKK